MRQLRTQHLGERRRDGRNRYGNKYLSTGIQLATGTTEKNQDVSWGVTRNNHQGSLPIYILLSWEVQGWSNSTDGRVLALHVAYPGLITSTMIGFWELHQE